MNELLEKWFLENGEKVTELSKNIWSNPEISLNEHYACKSIAEFLSNEGFKVKTFDVEDKGKEPNAVIASFGFGKPIIGIMGEYDSLKGLGQEAVSYYSPKTGPGHGCGHSQMAGCSVAAASAVKYVMEKENLKGTIIYFGTPAEEILQGKVYMVNKGYFDKLDVCFGWHPAGTEMSFDLINYSATTNMIFNFKGKTSHSGFAPWDGRSALDAAELTNIGVQYLREHITPDCRIHYIYLDGGSAPNIVPATASLYYYIRSKDENNDDLVRRVKLVAEGAAHMTETEVSFEQVAKCRGILTLKSLNEYCYKSALKVKPINYTAQEYKFAEDLYTNVTGKKPENETEALLPVKINPPNPIEQFVGASTDVGDVTHTIPTVQLSGCGMVKGLPTHHWAAVATSGMSIGFKALIYAASIISQSIYDILNQPEVIKIFWDEFNNKK